jgi:hypothetical protein
MTHAANEIAPTVPAGAVFKNDVSENSPRHTDETHLALHARAAATNQKGGWQTRAHVAAAGQEAKALVEHARVIDCRKGRASKRN